MLQQFGDTILDINEKFKAGLYKDESGEVSADVAMAEIATLFTEFHAVNADYFTLKDNKVNDYLVDLAVKMKDSDPFHIVTQYLQSKKHSKGQLGKKSRNAEANDNITKVQQTHLNKMNTLKAKKAGLASIVEDVFSSRSRNAYKDKSYFDPTSGKAVAYSTEEVEAAILSSPEFNKLENGQQYYFLGEIGITPDPLLRIVEDAGSFLMSESGNLPSSPEDLSKIEQGFIQYHSMKNAGMDLSSLNDDLRKSLTQWNTLSKTKRR